MLEFDDEFEIPVVEPEHPTMSPEIANEQAFYATEAADAPEQFDNVRFDLERKGENVVHNAVQEGWAESQEDLSNNLILDTIQDSTLTIQERKALFDLHTSTNGSSTNLRDQYIQENASTTVIPAERTGQPVRERDLIAQDNYVDTVLTRIEAHDELQRMHLEWANERSISAGSVIGGIAGDFLPFALPNFRLEAGARAAGLSLDVSNSSQGILDQAANITSSFLASGSVSRKVSEAFRDAPPEQKIEILKAVVKGVESIPGTDFNKFIALQQLIEVPLDDNVDTGLLNILGVLEATPLGQFVTQPAKFVRWISSFNDDVFTGGFNLLGRKQKSVIDDSDIISQGVPEGFGAGVFPDEAAVFTDPVGNKIIPIDTFLPNHNVILPAPKPKKKPSNNPTSATPNHDVISLGDKQIKENFPQRHKDIVTEFDTPETGAARGNFTDTPVGVDADNAITAERVANDMVEGQNFGQQQAAKELLALAKSVPTAKDNQVFIDDLWQAAGGQSAIPLEDFKELLKDMHVKGSINLGFKKTSDVKGTAATLKGAKDEDLNVVNFDTPAKRTIADDLDSTSINTFGDDLVSAARVDAILDEVLKPSAEILASRINKVYSSSFADKEAGRSLMRVNSSKFDEAFAKSPGYIGANGVGGSSKKYNRFTKFLKNTKHIEMGSVEVDAAGAVKFLDGAHRHAVLRDQGTKSIPVSMDPESIINANKHGLLDGVVKETPRRKIQAESTTVTRSVVPSIPPNSPAGSLSAANPVAAANKAIIALQDDTGAIALKMGASRAKLYGEWGLPKLQVAVEERFPNVAKTIIALDKISKASFVDSGFDLNITPHVLMTQQVDTIVDALNSIKGGTYQQSNSTLDFGKDGAHGIAMYGDDANYGFSNLNDASDAYDILKTAHPNFPIRIVQKDTEFFVQQEWERKFDHFDRFNFGLHSLQANFLGIDVSFIARHRIGDHLIPVAMSDTPDLSRVGGASLNEIKANKIEVEFIRVVDQFLLQKGMPLKELHTELRKAQESQRWLQLGELEQANAHLRPDALSKLVEGYEVYRRLADYNYQWVNRIDRKNADAAGHKGIYDGDGNLAGLGTADFPPERLTDGSVAEVWSYELDRAIPTPQAKEGMEILLARGPIRGKKGEIYQFVVVSGKYEKGLLPSRTLPKVEGYVPRKNMENWYVDMVPTNAVVNGRTLVDAEKLRDFTKTIGAGMTKPEALKLMAKLELEDGFRGNKMSVRAATENLGNAGVDDYTFFAKTVASTQKRGERLPTLNGVSTLEDPIQTLAEFQRAPVNVQVKADYNAEYKASFVAKFGEYTKGEYPSHPSQLQAHEAMSELELKEFKVAQRMESYLRELNTLQTFGDGVWASGWHKMADVLENITIGGADAAHLARLTARQGNLAVRIPKSIATVLFIHSNPLRQWLVQPQQLMELNAILPEYRKQSFLDIPAMITGMFSRAHIIPGEWDEVLYNSAASMSGMQRAEFDEVFEAFWDTGLPQAVDMNSMLLGALHEGKFNIDPSMKEAAIKALKQVVKAPGTIGKAIGFGPAELANITGTWLFTRQRFIKNNPGVNWNTPDNLSTITKQAWDISHSMIGRAGASPWQKGAIGTFLQFVTVQHRGMMQTLMSKTLTKQERINITAARLAIYGVHGVPLLAVSMGVVINEFGSDELKRQAPIYQGGAADIITNALTDLYLQDPNGVPADFLVSSALTPIPELHPFVDLFVEGKRLMFQEGGAPNPRFPGILAIGALAEAQADILDIYKIQELDTLEKLTKWIPEAAETFSGYNNFAKASMLKNFGDKMNKQGRKLGLQASEAAAFFQLFGFTTRQEVDGYLINNLAREQNDFVEQAARDVLDTLTKADLKFGTDDWQERQRQLQIIFTGISDDPSLIRSINARVDQMQVSQANSGSFRDTLYFKIARHYGDRNTEEFNKFMDILRRSTHPGDIQVLEKFEEMINTRIPGADLTLDRKLTAAFKPQMTFTDKEIN